MARHRLDCRHPDRTAYALAVQAHNEDEAFYGFFCWVPTHQMLEEVALSQRDFSVDMEHRWYEVVVPDTIFPGRALADLDERESEVLAEGIERGIHRSRVLPTRIRLVPARSSLFPRGEVEWVNAGYRMSMSLEEDYLVVAPPVSAARHVSRS